jgi:hypothetical protein
MMSTVLAPINPEPDPQLPLLSHEIICDPQTDTQREVQANLKNAVSQVVNSIQDRDLHDATQTIENNLHKLDTLMESLSLLEVLEFEARSLVDFIEARAMKAAAGTDRLHEVLDGITYGITHDLRRIFERELVPPKPLRLVAARRAIRGGRELGATQAAPRITVAHAGKPAHAAALIGDQRHGEAGAGAREAAEQMGERIGQQHRIVVDEESVRPIAGGEGTREAVRLTRPWPGCAGQRGIIER